MTSSALASLFLEGSSSNVLTWKYHMQVQQSKDKKNPMRKNKGAETLTDLFAAWNHASAHSA